MTLNILWDFDGTLVDSYRIYVANLKKVLGEHVHEQEIMSNLKISFSHTIEHYKLSQEQVHGILEMGQRVHPSEYRPFAGVEHILQKAERNFIVTHNSKQEVIRILDHYGWLPYFSEIIGREDRFPKKPADSAYSYLHDKHHIDLVIGDRELDIIPAKGLGIKTCMFQNLLVPGAHYYIESYEQLSRILDLKDVRAVV